MLPLWKICFKNIPLISFVSRKRPVASKIQSQWNIHRSQKFSSQLLEGKLATPLLAARKIANAPTSSTPVGAPKHPRVQPQPLPVAEVAIQRKVNLRNRRNLNSLWCSNITLHQGLCKKKPIIFNFPFNFLAYLILIALGEKNLILHLVSLRHHLLSLRHHLLPFVWQMPVEVFLWQVEQGTHELKRDWLHGTKWTKHHIIWIYQASSKPSTFLWKDKVVDFWNLVAASWTFFLTKLEKPSPLPYLPAYFVHVPN